jgi:hypothetical protein
VIRPPQASGYPENSGHWRLKMICLRNLTFAALLELTGIAGILPEPS